MVVAGEDSKGGGTCEALALPVVSGQLPSRRQGQLGGRWEGVAAQLQERGSRSVPGEGSPPLTHPPGEGSPEKHTVFP